MFTIGGIGVLCGVEVCVVDGVLGVSGSQLWDAIHAAREVPAHLSPLVLNACRVADLLDAIAEELGSNPPLTVTLYGKNGDEINSVANPLLIELRMQSAAFSQLMSRLGLDRLKESSAGKRSIADELKAAREAREARGA